WGPPCQILGLVDEARLARERRALGIRRPRLRAVLGVPDAEAPADPALSSRPCQQRAQAADRRRRQVAPPGRLRERPGLAVVGVERPAARVQLGEPARAARVALALAVQAEQLAREDQRARR